MLRINGKILTQDEIVRRLKITQGLKEDDSNEEVLIKKEIIFNLLENFSISHPKVNASGGVSFVETFVKRFSTEGLSYTARWVENGVPVMERVELFDNQTGDNANPVFWYKGETSVIFHHGRLPVFAGEEEFLLWLRMHPRCKTNYIYQIEDGMGGYKYIPPQSPLFKEIMPLDDTKKHYANTTLRLKAESLPMSVKNGKFVMDAKQVVAMAAAYGYPHAQHANSETLRLWLSKKAAANPERFLNDYNDGDFELASVITTALQAKMLHYDMKSRRFTWGKESSLFQKGATKGVIAQLPSGVTPEDAPMSLAKKLVADANHATINQIKDSVVVSEENPNEEANIVLLASKLGIAPDKVRALMDEKE